MSSAPAVILDLALIGETVEVSPPYAETRAIAASVLLERNHGARPSDPVDLRRGSEQHAAELRRRAVEERDRETYREPIQLTEEAAEAVAFLVAKRILDRVVYGRLKTRTGADYRLRPVSGRVGDRYERLEVSGIGGGTERATQRLKEKLEQLAEYPDEPPGFAIVTNFRDEPIEVLVERYAP